MNPEYFILKQFINPDYARTWANDALTKFEPMYHPFEYFNGFVIKDDQNRVDPENKLKEVLECGYYYFTRTYAKKNKMVVYDRSHGVLMNPGASLVSHKDVYDPQDSGSAPGNALVCNLFLTDDYDGGELVFEDLDVRIKPGPGDLVIFPGFLIKHGVREVKAGKRMNVVNHFFLVDIPQNMYEIGQKCDAREENK